MIVLEYDSTIEHSSVRFAEYTQHTEDITYYLFINSIYLILKSVYTLNVLKMRASMIIIFYEKY